MIAVRTTEPSTEGGRKSCTASIGPEAAARIVLPSRAGVSGQRHSFGPRAEASLEISQNGFVAAGSDTQRAPMAKAVSTVARPKLPVVPLSKSVSPALNSISSNPPYASAPCSWRTRAQPPRGRCRRSGTTYSVVQRWRRPLSLSPTPATDRGSRLRLPRKVSSAPAGRPPLSNRYREACSRPGWPTWTGLRRVFATPTRHPEHGGSQRVAQSSDVEREPNPRLTARGKVSTASLPAPGFQVSSRASSMSLTKLLSIARPGICSILARYRANA
jgi:hypothetical protein